MIFHTIYELNLKDGDSAKRIHTGCLVDVTITAHPIYKYRQLDFGYDKLGFYNHTHVPVIASGNIWRIKEFITNKMDRIIR